MNQKNVIISNKKKTLFKLKFGNINRKNEIFKQ